MAVVCGTDFSAAGEPAVLAAAALAPALGDGVLWLVHVLDASAAALGKGAADTVRAVATNRLEKDAAALADRKGLTVRTAVVTGSPSSALLDFAAESASGGLVVVASHGHAKTPLYRVGGTPERVAEAARMPVLVVRDAAPFVEWAQGRRTLRAVVGFDHGGETGALTLLEKLRAVHPCDVIAAHVYDAAAAWHRYGFPGRASIIEAPPELEALVARDLAKRVGELKGEGALTARARLGVGRVGDHLLEVAEQERADLIAVGVRQKWALGRLSSVTSVALHFAHASVLCVPGEARPRTGRFRSLLVATDLSPSTPQLVSAAFSLLPLGGEVHVVHVAEPTIEGDSGDDVPIAAAMREAMPPAPAGIVARTWIVRRRDPARAICEMAERVGADAICVSARGTSNLPRSIMGSVAAAVLRQSRQPVVVLPAP